MASILCETVCPQCHEVHNMELVAEAAAHDPQKIDIVITCSGCYTKFNSFIDNDMTIIESSAL